MLRRRQSEGTEVVNVNRTATKTMYDFNHGDPFTEYAVNVDGLVERNSVTGRVIALAETIIQTDQDSKRVWFQAIAVFISSHICHRIKSAREL